ncbi:hypothetical protein ACEQ8H_008788 [Pleosporales sp. CAS-2024a]
MRFRKLLFIESRKPRTLKSYPLWSAYKSMKMENRRLLLRLTREDWGLMWSSQAVSESHHKTRSRHVEELYDDMQFAGVVGIEAYRVEYLQCLFSNGKEEQALQKWESDFANMESSEAGYAEHLEAGSTLYARSGNADRAHEIMVMLYLEFPDWNSTLNLRVLRVHTASSEPRHHDTAHDIYGVLKMRLADKMTLDDFDSCFVGFLEARNLRYATEVLCDMVRQGFLAATDAWVDVRELVKRLHMLYRLASDMSSMTSIVLDTIKVLPLRYYRHLFGDLMKFAVVQNSPESVGRFLDAMIEQGYKPETYHFNMLLQALFRSNESSSLLKAENIGWRMIDEARKAYRRGLNPAISQGQKEMKQDSSVQSTQGLRNLPAADVTTYALIMHHHGTRLQWEHVDYLSRKLNETHIAPNATIMNVLMDNKIRQGAYADAWSIYKQLTCPPQDDTSNAVYPNGASIRHVWKMLRLALQDEAMRNNPNLPTPRQLLKETVEWWALCGNRHDADRFRIGLASPNHRAISGLMLHCFSWTQDMAGSLITLHVLRHKFNIFPSSKDLYIIMRQFSWVEKRSVRDQEKILARYAKIFRILQDQRHALMNLIIEDVAREEHQDLRLNLISEFIRVVMKRSHPPEMIEYMIDEAKQSIGCPNLPTGDRDAFEVA